MNWARGCAKGGFGLCLALAVAQAAMGAGLPILGWWGIPEDKATVERYREAQQAGFTVLMQGASSVEKTYELLERAQSAGIKLSVFFPEIGRDNMEDAVARLKNHPALFMWHVKDEPRYKDFEWVADVVRRIDAADGRHPCYVNHIANASVSMGVPDYGAYMERMLREFRPKLISADFYPCRLADVTRSVPYRDVGNEVYVSPVWYRQLEYLSGLARRERLPLALFACDVAHDVVDYLYPVPSVAMLRLQMYSNLAYGARMLQYFTYWNPSSKTPLKFHESIIREDGTRSPVYDRVRQVNRELQARASVFMNSELVSVEHTGAEIPIGTRRLGKLPPYAKSLATPDGGAVVAQFSGSKFDALVVVNRSPVREMQLKIALDPSVVRILEDGSTVSAAAYGGVYSVAPGAAEIFVMKR
ncbi:MAG: hypothetical protein IKE55_06065 [Kiritimatiellae bacterium]|nr:hypothetical protein [Kiritimatiellia bacterium]